MTEVMTPRWLRLISLLRTYSLNWVESTPPPQEAVISKPLCCSRSRTWRTQKFPNTHQIIILSYSTNSKHLIYTSVQSLGSVRFFMDLNEVSYIHQGCIYLIKKVIYFCDGKAGFSAAIIPVFSATWFFRDYSKIVGFGAQVMIKIVRCAA